MNIQEQIKQIEKDFDEKFPSFTTSYVNYDDNGNLVSSSGRSVEPNEVLAWHRNSIKSILEGLKEREENAKEKMGYDLPTNDFCYSEHDIANSYDKAKQDTISHLQSLIKSLD